MKRFQIFALLVAVLALIGCASFDDLKDGNEMAVENQTNLEKNVLRVLKNYEALAKRDSSWEDSDQAIIDKQRKDVLEQLAINHTWLMVLREAIESEGLDANFFADIVGEVPGWIAAGKDIYDMIKSKKNK
jgi:hypothetical protein